MKRLCCVFALLLFGWAGMTWADVSLEGNTRQKLSLNGEWQLLKSGSDNLFEIPQSDQWEPVTVPHMYWRGYAKAPPWPNSVWYRRSLEGPQLQGRRAVLHFTRVGFQCRVYLNGVEIGNHIGAQVPFQFDVTESIRQGQPNELVVGLKKSVRAQRGEYDNMPTVWTENAPGMPAEAEDGTVAWPRGYDYWFGGINQPVSLVLVPQVYVDDIFIVPSVRGKNITVQAEIVSHRRASVMARVGAEILNDEQVVKRLKPVQCRLQPGGQRTVVKLTAGWPNPVLWDPDHPHLYHCRVTVEADHVRDEASDRFGFREIWREGSQLFLNGVPLLLRSDTHYAGCEPRTPDEVRDLIRDRLQNRHVNCLTIKGQTPAVPEYWNICDEEGMLLIHQVDIGQPRGPASYWDCSAAFVVEQLRSIRNHPSLVVQQLGNENTYGLGGGVPHANAPWVANLVRIYEAARAADPTRLRTPGGGDMDPGGISDFYDFHGGPMSAYHELVPNLHMVSPSLAWGNRDKPLMFSEWNETVTPTMCAVIGDEFFRPDPLGLGDTAPRCAYRLTRGAQAESFAIGAAEFRKQRVSAFNCFCLDHVVSQDNTPEQGKKNLEVATNTMHPIVALPQQYAHNYWADAPIRCPFFVSNDSFTVLDGELVWRLSEGREVWQSGRVPVRLGPGQYGEYEVVIQPISATGDPVRLVLHYAVVKNGSLLFQDSQPLTIFPRPDWGQFRPVRLYDPSGQTTGMLRPAGVEFTPVTTLGDPAGSPLVIGTRSALTPTDWQKLEHIVAAGGQVLVLRPQQCPPVWCGVDLQPAAELNSFGLPFKPKAGKPHFISVKAGQASTYAFRRAPGHPILRAIADEDLRCWRGERNFEMPEMAGGIHWPKENIVSLDNLVKPVQGHFRCLVDAGYQKGMNAALLVEIPYGQGTALVTSMLLAEKAAEEPAAAVLLHRCLEYLVGCEPRAEHTIVGLSPCPGLLARGFEVGKPETKLDSGSVAVAAVEARRADWEMLDGRRDEIVRYVEAGGALYVHDLTPESAGELSRLLGLKILCEPVPVAEHWWLDPARIALPHAGHPLTAGLGNFDLNWTVFVNLIYGKLEMPDRLIMHTVHSSAPGAQELTEWVGAAACALLRIPLGKGQVVVDQVLWDMTPEDVEYISRVDVGFGPVPGRLADIVVTNEGNRRKANRYIATLFTNLIAPPSSGPELH